MDEVDIEDLTIEQYLRLTQENQTPKKIEDMTIADKSTPTHDLIRDFAHYFGPNQPDVESDCDSEDMEEEVEYMTDDEVVMSEQEECKHGYTQNIRHFEEKDDVDKLLNAEIRKHMSMQGVENTEDVLISIIKSIKKEMKDDIMKKQFEASTASISNETSSIANDHSLYAITTLEAKDNIMPLDVNKYLGLDKFRDAGTVENTIGTNEPLATIDILYIETIYMGDTGQEEETFDPLEIGMDLFSYESPACLEFEQRTRSYGTPNLQDEIAKPSSFLPDRRGLVKRWHVCKPIHVTYDDENGEDCGMWPTCEPDSKFCFGYNEVFRVNEQGELRMWICFLDHERRTVKGSYMGFADFIQVRYGQQKIDDTTRERRYYEWVAQNYEFIKHRTLTLTTLNDHFPYDTNNPIPIPQEHMEQEENEQLPIRLRP
ncbi:hypothetical protein Tco_1562452 [Tanacetum coccineum]